MYPEIHYKVKNEQIEICGCYGTDPDIVLPSRVEQKTVSRIASYCFADTEEDQDVRIFREKGQKQDMQRLSGSRIEKICLPEQIREIGNYAFYRCFRLKELCFTDSLMEIGGGAFTGCQLEKLNITCRHGKKTCLKKILEEQRFQMDVRITYVNEDGTQEKARLIFPEHYEEAVENTPARIVSTYYHGAGGDYRQCIYDRELDYEEYDSLFEIAKIREAKETAVQIALSRIAAPYHLGIPAKKRYEDFLRQECRTAIRWIMKEERELLSELLAKDIWKEPEVQEMLQESICFGDVECTAVLMDAGTKYGKKKKRFEL